MPRTARASRGGVVYHALNRGNGRAEVFHKEEDYAAFVRLMADAHNRLPMRVLAWCLMPNHFHLVLWPKHDGDLGRWMHWLTTSHVRRYHRHYATSGHVWQGRFKAFPIQEDHHLLTVWRYVERNPLRADLVTDSRDWSWSSLRHDRDDLLKPPFMHDGPVDRPTNWPTVVNQPMHATQEHALRECIARGRPYGSDIWARRIAQRLGLQSSLNPRGRPRKSKKK